MYKWVSNKPYKHHNKWRVWFRGLDGTRCHHTFDTEEAALAFVEKGKNRLLPHGGHPIGDLVDEYLKGRKGIRATSIQTLGFRIRTITKGREMVPIETFPWKRAWSEHVASQSVDSQHGIRSAVRDFITRCMKGGFLRRDPLADIEIEGQKKRGKKKLHIDESKVFVEEAMKHPEDPLSVASATLVYTGLRSDEVMGAQVRDLDADGTVLWVGESKTAAGRRGVEVADILRPYLQALAKDRQGQEYLIEFTPQRVRPCKNERKRRTDALLRRTRSICKAAGLPVVCSQSMRGLHSDLAAGFGVTGHAVAKALGHTSFSITKRHYVDRSIVENANLKKTLEVLCRDVAGNCPPKTSYRSAQEPSTKDMQKKENPRVTGG